ncbi:hypothetical protein F183_A51330 [Bryobacterales bacterium F-183]|nr:hypothetical protein F183_A51330 [Bryobacterales bacterium F-183]
MDLAPVRPERADYKPAKIYIPDEARVLLAPSSETPSGDRNRKIQGKILIDYCTWKKPFKKTPLSQPHESEKGAVAYNYITDSRKHAVKPARFFRAIPLRTEGRNQKRYFINSYSSIANFWPLFAR